MLCICSSGSVSVVVVVLIVPLVLSTTTGPKVCHLSVDTLSTDSLDPFSGLVSHHDTYTFLPAATISAFCDSASVELIRLILSSNVCPPSIEALNTTSQFSDFLVHHTM